jgi:hypothetical protein
MRQFKTWTNNLEKESKIIDVEKVNIQRIEYKV